MEDSSWDEVGHHMFFVLISYDTSAVSVCPVLGTYMCLKSVRLALLWKALMAGQCSACPREDLGTISLAYFL